MVEIRLSLQKRMSPVCLYWTNGGIGCIYPQITFFTLRSTIMAHKKIERKKELDRRRKRRAERIKARIHEAQAAAKNSK